MTLRVKDSVPASPAERLISLGGTAKVIDFSPFVKVARKCYILAGRMTAPMAEVVLGDSTQAAAFAPSYAQFMLKRARREHLSAVDTYSAAHVPQCREGAGSGSAQGVA